MNNLSKIGLILLVIGISLLISTVYRSDSSESFNYGAFGLFPLKPSSWSFDPQQNVSASFLWAPRNLQLDIKTNSTIDLYILNKYGLNLWNSKGELNPIWSFEDVNNNSLTLNINERNLYTFLIFNNANSSTAYAINGTLYGLENDLFWASNAFLFVGLITMCVSVFYTQSRKWKNKKTQQFEVDNS